MPRPRNFVAWTVIGTLLALVRSILGNAIAGLLVPEFLLTHLPLHSLIEGSGGVIALAIAGVLLTQMGHKAVRASASTRAVQDGDFVAVAPRSRGR